VANGEAPSQFHTLSPEWNYFEPGYDIIYLFGSGTMAGRKRLHGSKLKQYTFWSRAGDKVALGSLISTE
jgi:hypothetical protein